MPDNDQQDNGKCVTIIFNPHSGQGDPEERKAAISNALAAHGYTCQYIATTPEEGAREAAATALKQGVDLLAVSGGDGTVVEALAAVMGTDVAVAVFPAGTGNLLSVNLGISRDPVKAADAALFGRRRTLDLARITVDGDEPKYFAIIAGAGFDAEMIAGAGREAKDKLGLLAYVWAALKNLGNGPIRVAILLDDAQRPIRRRVKSVMVANMAHLQGGVELIPGAQPDDGVLDVALLKTERLSEWFRLIVSAVTHSLHETNTIEFYKAHKIKVDLSKTQAVEYDGEAAGETRSFTVEIVPGAVTIMVPKAAES
ncbi:MAG: diacylglycerol kinase family lipid kinase [Herpetosiphonaceae bacterium]|nr:diacylglycerol kinase family lipid kinase [Herpetosiphonaceae bacterium]